MGDLLFLCFPTFQPDCHLPTESGTRQSNRSYSSPSLANSTVVHNPPSSTCGLPYSPSSVQYSPGTTSQQCSTSTQETITTNSLQSLRESLKHKDISGKAAEIILCSWSKGTQRQYKPYIKRWSDFCSQWKTDPYDPPVNTFLDFLVQLHEKGLSYTTINTARSAISAVTLPKNNMTIGNHPIVSRFMKGIYKSTPPTPRYKSTWDVQPVLTYLSSFKVAKELDLKALTLKMVMLVALVSAQRGQSLHMLDINCMKEVPNGFEFVLPEHVKQSRPGYKVPSIMLHAYPVNQSLCVFTHMKEYLKKTESLRGTESKLLISFIKPHKRVSRETISRWIRSVMTAAGIDVTLFKPHSTRAAATSKAKVACIPIQDILNTAGWSSSRSFDKFYNKPIQTTMFASAVLNIDD